MPASDGIDAGEASILCQRNQAGAKAPPSQAPVSAYLLWSALTGARADELKQATVALPKSERHLSEDSPVFERFPIQTGTSFEESTQ